MATILTCCTSSDPGGYPTDTIATRDGDNLKITFFAHSSLAFEYDGRWIYVDPVSGNADYASLPKADFILVSHEHYDHLDSTAIAAIATPDTRIILPESSYRQLGKGEVMHNGDTLDLGFMQIEAIPAYNTTAGRQQFHPNTGRDNGYLLTLGGLRVYIAGDSEDTPEMLALKNIDIAFLPVNQPYTMTEEQAARVVRTMQPRIFYPYHYGQVDHKTDLNKLGQLIADLPGVEMRIRPLE